jgi:hypothetical protein
MYAYVGNDPMNATDPTGLVSQEIEEIFVIGTRSSGMSWVDRMMYELMQGAHQGIADNIKASAGEWLSGGRKGGKKSANAGDKKKDPCANVPVAPANVTISKNFKQISQTINAAVNSVNHAGRYSNLPGLNGFNHELISNVTFFKFEKNKGSFDFKQKGSQFENFGNFNFGAIGAELGWQEGTLLRGAGFAQKRAGTSKEAWGHPLGNSPFGDDPKDYEQIKKGIAYAKHGCIK